MVFKLSLERLDRYIVWEWCKDIWYSNREMYKQLVPLVWEWCKDIWYSNISDGLAGVCIVWKWCKFLCNYPVFQAEHWVIRLKWCKRYPPFIKRKQTADNITYDRQTCLIIWIMLSNPLKIWWKLPKNIKKLTFFLEKRHLHFVR